ncbi:MAG TPA: hypothetical protein VFT95_08470 [Micromonosporaceae bacterium]|nr:hypothetical protein [Micromonosporaceae bacterium]
MGSITPFATTERGHVRLEVDWSSHTHSPKCWIYRVVGGTASLIREGDFCLLSNSRACVYDTEAPLDTPMRYRTVAPLNANGDFQDTVEEWLDTTNTGTIGTVTHSSDYFVAGRATRSLRLVQAGSQVTVRACSEFIPATVGTSYTVSGRLMVPSNWTGGIGVQIFWFNGTTFLSASGAIDNLWPAIGAFELDTVTGTAPATTTQMKIVAAMTGTPPTDLPLYVGEMYVTEAASTVDSANVMLASAGSVWWKDPLHPAVNLKLQVDLELADCAQGSAIGLVGIGDRQRPADSVLLEVPDAELGVGVFARRKARRSSIRVASATLADAEALAALHAGGGPLLLQLPVDYGEPDSYGLYSELTTGRIATDHRVPIRVHAASYALVRPPVGAPDGVAGTRYSDLTKYSTYTAANAAGVTWFDALQGELAG